MKIEKLYKLSQFVDFVKSLEFDPYDGYSIDEFFVNNLKVIHRYNEFLKEPIKKEMFVNELEKPNEDDLTSHKLPKYLLTENYIYDLELWQEAERKVIFKESEYLEDDRTINVEFGINYQLSYWKDDNPTLHTLAEATNGELELQNVEL